MEHFIKKLFLLSGFQTGEPHGQVQFFRRADADRSEYYLVLLVPKVDLLAMDNYFDQVNQLFTEKKREAKDIEKNTSLIICVEFDSYLEDSPKFKNRLLQLEEDEFFYRKYVIPYTSAALSPLAQTEDIIGHINTVVSDETRFEGFNSNIYSDEPYFLSMQLFIKLPFLSLNINRSSDFVPINTLLSARIAARDFEYLEELLSEPLLEPQERDKLLQKILDPADSAFDDFFQTNLGDAPST